MNMLFTHNKKSHQNNKLQIIHPINVNTYIDSIKREPLHNVFQGMVFRVNSGNRYCESCNKR